MQPGVKISASSPNGGYITVNRTNGKAGVIIACTPMSGAVVVNDAKGKLLASLPATNPEGI
jgi:predicted ribosome-associated RNA-binding protein Tma20